MAGRPPLTPDLSRLITDPFHGLDDGALQALAIAACPHWLPASAILLHFKDDVLPELPELIRRDLVRVTSSGAVSVPAALRDTMLSDLLDRARIAAIAERLVPAFESGANPESRIEAYYHQLFLDPLDASRRMFGDALAWSSEPLFAFNLLQRLIKVWQEFDSRWGLEGPAAAYLRFVELVEPARRRPPGEELEILDRLGEPDDPLLAAYVDLRAGLALTAMNRSKRAHSALSQAYERFESIDHLQGCAQASRALGRLSTKIDRFEEARAFHQRALALSRKLGHPVMAAQSLHGLADIESYQGDLGQSAEHYDEAIDTLSAHGGRTAEANARTTYAQLLVMRGDLGGATEHLRLARQIYESTGQRLGLANSLKAQAMVSIENGDLDAALTRTLEAEAIYVQLGTTTGIAASRVVTAEIRMMQGAFDAASSALDDARAMYAEADDGFGVATCLRDAGALALQRGQSEGALDLLGRSAAKFGQIGARVEAALATFLASLADAGVGSRAARRLLSESGVALPRPYWQSWASATGRSPTVEEMRGGLWHEHTQGT